MAGFRVRGAHWGAMAGFCVTPSGWVPDRISATPRLLLLPRASPGTKEPPLQASTQHPQSPGGLSPGLCRPRPHPPSPPPRWRSCWHWTRSGRSPSALLLSGLQSPLCHRQRPIRPHPRRTPPGPRASPGPGRPVRIQPNTLGVALQLPRPRSLLSPLPFLKCGSDHVPPLLKTLS